MLSHVMQLVFMQQQSKNPSPKEATQQAVQLVTSHVMGCPKPSFQEGLGY